MEKELDKFGRPLPEKQGRYYLPSVTTDALVFRDREDGYHDILLVTRKNNPCMGCLAFPGGFVDYNEDPLEGCLRELKEECSVDDALYAEFYELRNIVANIDRLAFDHAKILKKGIASLGLSEQYGIN